MTQAFKKTYKTRLMKKLPSDQTPLMFGKVTLLDYLYNFGLNHPIFSFSKSESSECSAHLIPVISVMWNSPMVHKRGVNKKNTCNNFRDFLINDFFFRVK